MVEQKITKYEKRNDLVAAALLYVADAITDLAASIRELRTGESTDLINCKGSLEGLVTAVNSLVESGDNASKEVSMSLETIAEKFES